MTAFSVPVTLASSRKTFAPTRPAVRMVKRRFASISAPSFWNAWRCVSTRRRPITSPPGGGTIALPKRASSGPASSTDARILLHSSSSSSVFVTFAAWTRRSFVPEPLDLDAEVGEQVEHRLHVEDPRHVVQQPPRRP